MCIYNRLQQVNPHFFLGEAFQCRFVLFPSAELYWISAYGILIIFRRWGNSGHWTWWLPYSSAPIPTQFCEVCPEYIVRLMCESYIIMHLWQLIWQWLWVWGNLASFLGVICRSVPHYEKCSKVEKFWDQYWTSNILSLLAAFRMIPYPLEKGHLFYPYPICTETADRELLPCKCPLSVQPLRRGLSGGGNEKCFITLLPNSVLIW